MKLFVYMSIITILCKMMLPFGNILYLTFILDYCKYPRSSWGGGGGDISPVVIEVCNGISY